MTKITGSTALESQPIASSGTDEKLGIWSPRTEGTADAEIDRALGDLAMRRKAVPHSTTPADEVLARHGL